MKEWLIELEYKNSVFYTWKGYAVTEFGALHKAKQKAKATEDGDVKLFKIKLLGGYND